MPNPHRKNPHYVGANDNSPAWIMDSRKRQTPSNPFRHVQPKPVPPLTLAPLFPLLAVMMIAGLFLIGAETQTLTTTAGLIGVGGLVWAGFCGRVKAWRSREFTGLTIIAALALAGFGTAALSGVTLNMVDLAMITGCLGLGVAGLFSSRAALLTSALAVTLWLLTTIPAFNALLGFGESGSAGWIVLLPIFLLGQIILSSKLLSTLCLAVCLLVAYGWAIWLGLISDIPLAALAGLGFAIGIAHHRIGKSMEDDHHFGAAWHGWVGVLAALGTALFLQSVWLDPAMAQAIPGWMPTQSWWLGLGLASLALFVASLQRYKHSRLTLPGIFILSAVTLLLPLISIKPALVREVFTAIPGLSAAPGMGLVIGAAIMAAGLAWVANGLRRLRLGHVVIGAGLVGVQAVIFLAPGRATLDSGIVFICSLIAALCIGGLVAGASLDHTRPARRRM